MGIHVEDRNNVKVIKFEGKLDLSLSISIETELDKFISEGTIYMMFDLSGVEYLSSSGLRVFIVFMRSLKEKGGKLVLACVPDTVKKIFKTVELDDLFEVYDSVSDGLASFSSK